MRAVELASFGIEHLRRVERPEPTPGPGEVVVAMRAASLNYRDLMMIEGRYNPRQRLPLVPLSDGVGLVSAVGAGVERVRVGDRVATVFAQGWLAGEPTRAKLATTLGGPLDGTLVESMRLSAEGVVPVPEHLTDEEAATLTCAGVTAWSALEQAAIGPGDVVLVQGTGGVSLFALQLATLRGARVLVTSSREDKRARALALGAEAAIDYGAEPEWGKAARELAGPRGVDLVVEVGGAGTMAQSLRCVRPGGTVAVIGVLTGGEATTPLTPILMQEVRLQGILVGHRERFESLMRAVAAHRLRPVVDSVFPLDEVADAFRRMKAAEHFGKIVVRVAS